MISEDSIPNFMVVGDSEFAALRSTGDYEVRNEDCLFRQEGADNFFHVMRRSEWERLSQAADKVDREINEMERDNKFRGM